MYDDFDIEYENDNPFYFAEEDEIEDNWEEDPVEDEEFEGHQSDSVVKRIPKPVIATGEAFQFEFNGELTSLEW